MTRADSQRYYNSSMNEIIFPAESCSPLFYDPRRTMPVNYGAMARSLATK